MKRPLITAQASSPASRARLFVAAAIALVLAVIITAGTGPAVGALPPAGSGQPVWQITASLKRTTPGPNQSVRLTLYANETAKAEFTFLGFPGASHEFWDIAYWAVGPGRAGDRTLFLFDVTVTIPDVGVTFRRPLVHTRASLVPGHYTSDFGVVDDPEPGVTYEIEVTKIPTADVTNLALGKSVTASNWLGSNPPSTAVDGNAFTYWNSGNFPTQWIEVDLGTQYAVGEVSLFITQLPDGDTVHRVYGKANAGDPWTLLREFAGFTMDLDALRAVAADQWNIRWLRVETTASPSWVAWREIGVYPAN